MSEVVVLERPAGFANVTRDYLELSKSRIVMMVLITTAAGYFFAATHVDWMLLLNTLIGTALVAAGTNALNQYIERDHDAKMQRTRLRPLPDGRISPRAALFFSVCVSLIGTIYLGIAVNWLTAALGAFTLTTYIYLAGAIVAGSLLTFISFAFLDSRTPVRARRLFMASNIYLIVMMALLVFA